MKQIFPALCTFIFFPIAASAQASDSLQKPQLKLSLNYHSDLNYYGRTDSLKSTGFFPLAELWITPKFYINAAPVFVSNKLQAFDYAGTVATIGYQAITAEWLSNVYVMKPFYEPTTSLVQSALQAQAGFLFTRLNKILNITAGADVKWSNQLDVGATAGVDHIFRMERGKAAVVVDPSAYVYAGTQRFSKTYLVKKKGGLLQAPSQHQVTESSTAFHILAYEFSMPIVYARGKWQVLLTPSYVIPQHLLQMEGRPDLSEQGQNLFYTTLALKHTF